MVVIGQKYLYSSKSGYIRAKVVVFGGNGCIRRNWLFSGKVVLFGISVCIRAKKLYSGKVVVFVQT